MNTIKLEGKNYHNMIMDTYIANVYLFTFKNIEICVAP